MATRARAAPAGSRTTAPPGTPAHRGLPDTPLTRRSRVGLVTAEPGTPAHRATGRPAHPGTIPRLGTTRLPGRPARPGKTRARGTAVLDMTALPGTALRRTTSPRAGTATPAAPSRRTAHAARLRAAPRRGARVRAIRTALVPVECSRPARILRCLACHGPSGHAARLGHPDDEVNQPCPGRWLGQLVGVLGGQQVEHLLRAAAVRRELGLLLSQRNRAPQARSMPATTAATEAGSGLSMRPSGSRTFP